MFLLFFFHNCSNKKDPFQNILAHQSFTLEVVLYHTFFPQCYNLFLTTYIFLLCIFSLERILEIYFFTRDARKKLTRRDNFGIFLDVDSFRNSIRSNHYLAAGLALTAMGLGWTIQIEIQKYKKSPNEKTLLYDHVK